MAPRVVGLDIGSHAVRAAELRLGDPPELRAFGQVGLAPGAIEHGEVVDPAAVASAIKRLWRESHIRDRRVRIGLASLRTIVRQVEMPAMEEEELRSALEFQAGDFIPLPIEDTVLDFRVLESFESDDGEPMLRVLLAAVHRDTLELALTAVREAGLQAVAVDLVPFALLRSVRRSVAAGAPAPSDEGEPEATDEAIPAAAEAIVSVGSGVTVVVVHEGGVPRFVRIVDNGGDDLTEAIAESLDLAPEEAETLKRRLDEGADRADEARAAMEGPLSTLINEIRGSIDFYTSQAGAMPVSRVFVTGGGALASGFLERLRGDLDGVVEEADPLRGITIADIGFEPDEIERLRPYAAVPLGLALGGAKEAAYVINLLPAGERRVLATSRVVAAAVAATLVVLVILALLTIQRSNTLNDEKDKLAAQQARNQALQAQITQLQSAQQLQDEVDQGHTRLATVLATDVAWSRMLQEIARVIPADVWLTSFGGTLQAGGAAGAAAPANAAPGTISGSATFQGTGTDFPSAAAWLQRLATLPSFDSPWVSQIQRGETSFGGGSVPTVTFSSSADITDAARSERSAKAREQAGVTPQSGGGTTPSTTTTTTAGGA